MNDYMYKMERFWQNYMWQKKKIQFLERLLIVLFCFSDKNILSGNDRNIFKKKKKKRTEKNKKVGKKVVDRFIFFRVLKLCVQKRRRKLYMMTRDRNYLSLTPHMVA